MWNGSKSIKTTFFVCKNLLKEEKKETGYRFKVFYANKEFKEHWLEEEVTIIVNDLVRQKQQKP